MFKVFSYILLLSIATQAYAADIPDFSANYLVKLNGIQAGELKRSLTTAETGIRTFNSVSQAKGIFSFFKPDLVEESSQWQLVDNDVQPQHYLYQRTGGKKDKTLSVSFDWQQLVAQIDDKKQPWQLKIEPKTLDKLVYQISLMRDLNAGLTHFNYNIADGGKLKNYKIEILGEEIITTPMGKIKTLKLTRKRDKPKDRETTLWCAPELHYLPVKLEHLEDGTRFTAMIRQLEGITYEHAFTTMQTQTKVAPIGQP